MGAASRMTPVSEAHVAGAGTLAPGAPTDYVAGGAGSAAPWWGLFMAVPGSPTFFPVVVLSPLAAEAPELEVGLRREQCSASERACHSLLPGIERNLRARDKGPGRGSFVWIPRRERFGDKRGNIKGERPGGSPPPDPRGLAGAGTGVSLTLG